MSNHNADSFEGQQRILEDLIDELQYMQSFLTAFKDAYWNQILKVKNARMMINTVNSIENNLFPPYRQSVKDTVDELKRFEMVIRRFIDEEVQGMHRDSNNIMGH